MSVSASAEGANAMTLAARLIQTVFAIAPQGR